MTHAASAGIGRRVAEYWAGSVKNIGSRRRNLRVRRGLGVLGLLAILAIVFRSDVSPSVSLLHMLFTIALTLALIRARVELAFEHGRRSGMFIVHVTISLLLRWPAILVVLATGLATLPWSGVRLLVLPVV